MRRGSGGRGPFRGKRTKWSPLPSHKVESFMNKGRLVTEGRKREEDALEVYIKTVLRGEACLVRTD